MTGGSRTLIHRVLGVTAWLFTASISALWLWVIVDGGIFRTMFSSRSAEEQRALAEAMAAQIYAPIVGINVVTLAYATVGLLLVSRRGGGRVGAILLAGAAVFSAVPFGFAVGGTLILRDPQSPIANLVFLLGAASVPFGYALILPVVALAFPDGRLPSSNWRWPVLAALGALAGATILIALTPGPIEDVAFKNPLGVLVLPDWLTALAGPLFVVGSILISVLGVAAVLARYRRGADLERHQLRWFVVAVLIAAVPFMLTPLGGGFEFLLLSVVGLVLIPVSVWIAVTRHRLYEIDRLISRGVSWAALSGLLVAVYGGTVLLLQSILGGVTQGQTLAVAGSTLLAAALFQPLRRRIQSVVDRRFDRARYDAQRTAEAFSESLRNEVELGRLRSMLVITADRAVRPAAATVWLRGTAK